MFRTEKWNSKEGVSGEWWKVNNRLGRGYRVGHEAEGSRGDIMGALWSFGGGCK